MLTQTLLIAHIAVLGYWLGSELVINSTYRHATLAADMPFEFRDRLMDHVMDVDQHVRYALVLQLVLGFLITLRYGWLPGGTGAAWAVAGFGAAWLALVEVAHRRRKASGGRRLATFDRGLRYAVMALLSALGIAALAGALSLPRWLAWKLLCFAGVMACGVGIRLVLIRYFEVWAEIGGQGSSRGRELLCRTLYRRATGILVLLWVFIALAVGLSVLKP